MAQLFGALQSVQVWQNFLYKKDIVKKTQQI